MHRGAAESDSADRRDAALHWVRSDGPWCRERDGIDLAAHRDEDLADHPGEDHRGPSALRGELDNVDLAAGLQRDAELRAQCPLGEAHLEPFRPGVVLLPRRTVDLGLPAFADAEELRDEDL